MEGTFFNGVLNRDVSQEISSQGSLIETDSENDDIRITVNPPARLKVGIFRKQIKLSKIPRYTI